MNDERERLFNRFHNLALLLIDLGAIVQNEMSKEFVDIALEDFEDNISVFNMEFNTLTGEVVEHFRSK